MNPTQKAILINIYNLRFEHYSKEPIEKNMSNWFDRVVLQTTVKGRTTKQIKKIIQNTPITTSSFTRTAYNNIVLSGITNIIEKQQLPKEDKQFLTPILAVVMLYGLNKPNLIAKKTHLITNAIISGDKTGLSKRDLKALPHYKDYFVKNDKFIKELIIDQKQRIKQTHREIKSTESKMILKDLKRETKVIIKEKINGKEISRPQSASEIRTKLRTKFGKQLDYRVRRIVDTELKQLQERAKIVQHTGLGYTKKKWHTQSVGFSKTDRHAKYNGLDGQIRPIDKKFRVGASWGMYPVDSNLPAGESINCKCYTTFTK